MPQKLVLADTTEMIDLKLYWIFVSNDVKRLNVEVVMNLLRRNALPIACGHFT